MAYKKRDGITIRFEPDGKVATKVVRGENLLKIATGVGAGIRSECGGKGTCKKCLIRPVGSNFLSPLEKREKDLLGAEKIQQGIRLACQASVQGSGTVMILKESQIRSRKLQMRGKEQFIDIEPRYVKIFLNVPPPTLEDSRSDLTRISEEVQKVLDVKKVTIDPLLLQTPPESFRQANWDLLVTVKDHNEIMEIISKNGPREVLGVSVDIGTSKIVGHLVDLQTSKTLAMTAVENPQLPYGEDIISRMKFAMSKPGNLDILKNAVVNAINEQIIGQLTKQQGVKNSSIYSITVVGNTCMQHLFLGVNPEFLGRSPYVPVFTESVDMNTGMAGLNINPTGNLAVFPSIGGVIGGDCVAVALATKIDISDDLCLAVDVGTNTEIILGNRDSLTATSCASGPAFEGYHIHDGMKAVEGAIEHLIIDPDTFDVDFQVIGDTRPTGICGSAIIDCLAELLKAKIIDNRGRINPKLENKRLIGEKKERAFIIALSEETATDHPLVFTQEDIRNIQLAKAAVLTGAYLLMEATRTSETDIKHVYLAGAFGNQVNPVNAKVIGLLPDFPQNVLEFVGNAAITGAKLALLSKKALERAKNIAGGTKYLELALNGKFQREFVSAMFLPHENPEKFQSLFKK